MCWPDLKITWINPFAIHSHGPIALKLSFSVTMSPATFLPAYILFVPVVSVMSWSLIQVSTYAVIWPSHRLLSCSVVAVAARDADRAAKFAKWHRIPRSYGSYDDLLADPEIDAVYIGLPNGLHGHWAKRSGWRAFHSAYTISYAHSSIFLLRSLAAGKHVLVEKPFASNEKEAKEVMLLSRRKGLLCREAFHYQEHPLNQRLIQLMRPDLSPLGRIQRIDTKLLIPRWVMDAWMSTFICWAYSSHSCSSPPKDGRLELATSDMRRH